LHIITNGFHFVQDKKLRNSKIDHFFKTVTNSELAGAKKPSPIIFEHALTIANAKKETSLMIGDSLEADIEGALNYGMDAIYFNGIPSQFQKPIYQITHLLDLKNIL
jgi:putative hydrolase of the HAD superfamily